MRDRVLIFTGSVETLDYFSLQLADAFLSGGRDVFVWDLRRSEFSRAAFDALPDPENTTIVSFNFTGFCNEDVTLLSEEESGRPGETVFEEKGLEILCICVDSPIYYVPHLLSGVRGLHPVCIDRNHAAFLERFFPAYGKALYLPSAGNLLPSVSRRISGETVFPGLHAAEGGREKWFELADFPSFEEWTRREIPVIFTGNYVPQEKLRKGIRHLAPEYVAFLEECIRDFELDPDLPMEEGLLRRIDETFYEPGEAHDREEDLKALYSLSYVDLSVRTLYRGRLIRTLAEAGIPMFLTGKDWELLPCGRPENLRSTGHEITSAECLKWLQKSRISLNLMPWFKKGVHDRIFQSQLCGCAVLTDPTEELLADYADGGNIALYGIADMQSAVKACAVMLEDTDGTYRMAKAGYVTAAAHHTWAQRAKALGRMDFYVGSCSGK
ncbi:MAG: glycosyltransferase [Lachnospiraceae bacterium]|nr:glycosyltransferase [Lachnospiraceae bacterium]